MRLECPSLVASRDAHAAEDCMLFYHIFRPTVPLAVTLITRFHRGEFFSSSAILCFGDVRPSAQERAENVVVSVRRPAAVEFISYKLRAFGKEKLNLPKTTHSQVSTSSTVT